MSSIADAIAALCADLSAPHTAIVAATCTTIAGFDSTAKAKIESKIPAPRRSALKPLFEAWQAAPSLSGSAIAIAIESATAALAALDAPCVDVVCTGPSSPHAAVRLTSEVVRQLIDAAKVRVTISSFSSYKVPSVMAALDTAIARGVKVDLILESQSNLNSGGAETFDSYNVYVWPTEQRPLSANMHAKAVIVDSQAVLLTSANLSNAAFDKNLELGALIRGGGVAKAMQRHFDALISSGVLRFLQA